MCKDLLAYLNINVLFKVKGDSSGEQDFLKLEVIFYNPHISMLTFHVNYRFHITY